MSQQQELGLRAQVLEVVPPGPIHRNRRSAVAKFSHRIPNFRDPSSTFSLVPDPRAQLMVEQAGRKKEETVSRLRQAQSKPATDVKVPLLLEQRHASAGGSGPAAVVYKGTPEAGGGANVEGPPLHYVLFRSGNRVTAFPAEQWFGFKPHVDRRGLYDSVNSAAKAQAERAGADGKGAKGAPLDPFALRLVPKSLRMEKQRQEEEARERQEQVAAGRLLPLAGAVEDDLGGGGRLKRFVDEDELEAELFGNDEEDEAPRFGGKAGKGGGKKGRGRGLRNADGEELEEDEVPEDLYSGPRVDEDLRPEKPEEAEDWEHEFAPDDDDQDQGADDEVYDDDPGMRKKLGIEGDDEDEGEEADEQSRKLKKLGDPDDSEEEDEGKKKAAEEEAAKRQQAAAEGTGAGGSGAGGGGGEDEEPDDEDEDELEELDGMEEEPRPAPPRPPPAPPAVKPPPAPAPAAAPAAAGAKRKLAEEPPRPAAEGAKRARTATPPPPQAATAGAGKPPPTAVPSAAAAQQPQPSQQQQSKPAAAPPAAAGGPPVTAEEVIELLRSQPNGIMPFPEFTRHFSKRTTTPELRNGLKSLTVSLCKSSKENGVLMVSLKK